MENLDYLNKKSELKEKYESDLKELAILFAESNNPHKIGDIIYDHGCGNILHITSFVVNFGNSYPNMIYSGIELSPRLKPYKRQYGHVIYQHNIITKEQYKYKIKIYQLSDRIKDTYNY